MLIVETWKCFWMALLINGCQIFIIHAFLFACTTLKMYCGGFKGFFFAMIHKKIHLNFKMLLYRIQCHLCHSQDEYYIYRQKCYIYAQLEHKFIQNDNVRIIFSCISFFSSIWQLIVLRSIVTSIQSLTISNSIKADEIHLPKCIGFIVYFMYFNITMSHRFDFGNLIKHTAIVGEITLFTFDIVFNR